MTEASKTPETEPEKITAAPPAPEAPPAATEPDLPAAVDEKDVAEGKAFGILSYALSFIGIPFFLVPLIMRNNAFALYHAKQCLMIWLAAVALSLASAILTLVCIGPIVALVGALFLLVLNVMGLINAVNDKQEQVPVIGKWGVEWFAGLTKV